MNLQTIKQYFGDQMVLFNQLPIVNDKLTTTEKKIFYEIGLPNYGGYGGAYIMLADLSIHDGRYLRFATRKNDEQDYFEYLDLETNEVVFKFYSDKYIVLNSSLEAYLTYVYTYIKFFKEVRLEEKYGLYELNHAKYAEELQKQLLTYNDDVLKGSWAALIEEMGYGVV